MDFSGKIVLCFIEEDNIQRAYFRIRPLLVEEGAVAQADIDALPDNGYLRIVPDKNEQYTFKERMRQLGNLCVLDLCNLPPDTFKIRTNKNYAPQRGESNQYIVYSDAVKEIPHQLFYEVISAEPGEKEKIAQSATPLCYLRSGGRINGPVSRGTGLEQEGAAPLAPDSEGIYAVTLPDGAEKLFYWPRQIHTPEPVVSVADGEEVHPQEERREPERKLNGMPLYQTVARRPAVPQRAHNALVDAVSRQQWNEREKLEAPGAVISSGTVMRPVENPMEVFRRSLDKLWAMPDMQRQAAAHFLSMTGVQNILNQQLAHKGSDAVISAMNSQIQDLEAERLSLLMQVEAAQKDMSALRQEALSQASAADKEMLQHVEQQIAAARQDLEKIETERGKLLEERDQTLADLEKADPDLLYIKAEVGGYADLGTLCQRVQQSLAAVGMICEKNDALHLLTLLCVAPERIELQAPAAADALTAAGAFAGALGVPAPVWDEAMAVRLQEGGDSFRMVVGHYDLSIRKGCTKLIVAAPSLDEDADDAYQLAPWPVVALKAADGWKFTDLPACQPVKAAAVREAVMNGRTELPGESLQLLDQMAHLLEKEGAPLAQTVRRQMYEYLSCAAAHLEGGIADALDYAACAWIVPHMKRHGVSAEKAAELVQGLPRTRKLLER